MALAKEVTSATSADLAAANAAKKVVGPLLFNWSDGETITDNTWLARKKSIFDGQKDGQKLEITGLYRSEETNNTNFENLGIARANETRKLFSDLKDDNLILLGKLVDDEVEGFGSFSSIRFANRIVNKSIKETSDATQIYFS